MSLLISCPSCAGSFEVDEETLGVKATRPCPLCGRIVVVRDANVVKPSGEHGTVPFDPGTEAAVEPVREADEPTAVGRAAARAPSHLKASIAILDGGRKGDVVRITGPRLVIGREGAGADLELPDTEVSRSHAAVEWTGGTLTLRDLGSRNGTFVDTERVQVRELEDRTEFRVGHTRLLAILTTKD